MKNTRVAGAKKIFIDSKSSYNKVESRITVSKDLEKYFRCYDFFSSYDEDICPSRSIINIPVLSIVLPIAWITGADVYVDELDDKFVKSMDALQLEYKKIYPKAPFKTRLFVSDTVESEPAPNDTALLFSGGIDSTYSLFSNVAVKPRLIMIFGVMDIPISNVKLQERIKTEYSNFAEREGLNLNFIHTNALEIMDHNRLRHLWGRFQGGHEGDFWNGIGYALGHVGQVAPLSIDRFSHLISAASYDAAHSILDNPDASSPDTDEKIAWGNLEVKHDGNLHRYQKMVALKNLLKNGRIKLRVCWSEPEFFLPYDSLNCSRCEKCLRTIASLVYVGIDPNECGFNVDDSTFKIMRFLFEENVLTHKQIKIWWKPLQKLIPDDVEFDFHGSKEFFEWFKTKNLDLTGKKYRTLLHSLYFKFPFLISHKFKKVYDLIAPGKYQMYQPIELDKNVHLQTSIRTPEKLRK